MSSNNNVNEFLKECSDYAELLLNSRDYILLSEIYDMLGIPWQTSYDCDSPNYVIRLKEDKFGIDGWHNFMELPEEIRLELLKTM